MTASVRIDDESFDRLKQLAEEEDRPMTRIVRAAVELYDQVKLAKATGGPIKPSKPVIDGPAIADDGITPVSGCPHPKEERRVHSWGSSCGVCGAKIK